MKRFLLAVVFVVSFASLAQAQRPYYIRHYRSPSYGYGTPIGYGAGGYGGYYNGFGYYQPWSTMTYASPYGGAVTQYYGGVMGPGFYMPYTFSGYTPGFYGGYGWGGGY